MSGQVDRPLPEQLVRAAGDAVAMAQCARHDEGEYHWDRRDGVAAAVAVLRTLAAAGATLEDFGADMPAACAALADAVEGGEQG